MSFENYFVRITYELLKTNYKRFLELDISPEVYIDGISLSGITEKEKEELGVILDNFGSHTIHAPFFDISTGGNDNEVRDLSFKKLSNVIEIGKKWSSKLVVIHYNYDRLYYGKSFDKWIDRSEDFFKRLTDIPDHPLIAIENIDDPSPDVALELDRRVGSNRIIHCFDYGHHNVFGKISSTKWLKRIDAGKHIHFHFHDNDGSCDDHLPMGDGEIDWKKAKGDIIGLKSSFSVTLEPHSERDLIRSLNYYRRKFLPEESKGFK